MGDLPLRTPTHRRLGGPLPRQLANAPHAHPPPDRSFPRDKMPHRGLRGISRDFSRLSPCGGQVAYVLLTRAPVAGKSQQADSPAAPRLACVKPVASVHPEPGSNSSLLYLVFFLFFLALNTRPRGLRHGSLRATLARHSTVCPNPVAPESLLFIASTFSV